MHWSDPNQYATEKGVKDEARRVETFKAGCDSTMRAMFTVPYSQTGLFGWQTVIGERSEYVRPILDLNFQRRGVSWAQMGEGALRKADEEFLSRLAAIRAQSRKPDADPLLWFLRIRAAHTSPSYTFGSVQRFEASLIRHQLDKRIGKEALSYRALAAWACRCSANGDFLGAVYREVRHQVRHGDPSQRVYLAYLSEKAAAWLTWLAAATGDEIRLTDIRMAGRTDGAGWRTDVAYGCHYQGLLERMDERIGAGPPRTGRSHMERERAVARVAQGN